jgi:acetyl esterase/lipase
MTVVNVCYRLAPEAKAPGGIDDGYAALKWVIKNA